jgi:hypothetical protein
MIKNFQLKIILFWLFLFLIIITQVSLADTPTPSPAFVNTANCDACGYCQDTKASLVDRWTEAGIVDPTPQAKEWTKWVSNWKNCQKCLYPGGSGDPDTNVTLIGLPTPDPENHYTMIGCISTKPGKFASQVGEFFFRIVGGIAFLFLLYGAGIMATSQADPERLNQGKRIIYGAIVGLLFVLFSTFIFNFIATNVLKIPGFGG